MSYEFPSKSNGLAWWKRFVHGAATRSTASSHETYLKRATSAAFLSNPMAISCVTLDMEGEAIIGIWKDVPLVEQEVIVDWQ